MLETLEERPGERSPRAPAREEIDPAALELIERHGPAILRTARRYSQTAEDAEDAYQRGLEILLTKAPSTDEGDLVPWLKTVVKHEAFALRRQREHNAATGDEALEGTAAPTTTDEQAEQRERLRVGAEAMARLKAHEVRCLLLLADGLSYRQIAEATGWSYTKVNRLATEGRRAFRAGIERIESGGECERLASQLCALADGEAAAEDIPTLRRHLRGCPACRQTLGEFRAVPARVAALAPPAAGLAATDTPGGLGGLLSSVVDWVQERAYGLGLKVQAMTEAATVQKTAAVAASTAVLAGGGVGAVKSLEGDSADDRSRTPAEPAARDHRSNPRAGLGPPARKGRPRRKSPPGRADARRPGPVAMPRSGNQRSRSAPHPRGASQPAGSGRGGEFSGATTFWSRSNASSAPSSTGSSPVRRGEFQGQFEALRGAGGSSARASSSGVEFTDR